MNLIAQHRSRHRLVWLLGVWAAASMGLGSLIAWLALQERISVVMSVGVAAVTLTIAVLVLQAQRKLLALIAATALCVGLSAGLRGAGIVFPPALVGLVILSRLLRTGISGDEASDGSDVPGESGELTSDQLPSLDRAIAREL